MSVDRHTTRRRPSLFVLLPLILFLSLAGVFLYQLVSGHDPQELPSALIGNPAPPTNLPPVEGILRADSTPVPGLDLAQGDGRPVLVNVFASWCVPCRQEHPVLMDLARDTRFRLVGINYKDEPNNARQFLAGLGNPYAAIGSDLSGRAGIDWGVYGVPETFLVSPSGTIVWKQTGPFSPDDAARKLEPALAKMLAEAGAG
ncbi:thiol:disulfide interchange protein [Aureimonas sp. SA4125]|uniref:DsbE family thiol:disulfide interchange protein n=1 Tax=Aureimonas sp. SA4125 TaxID=2826993 RepID=UPI001CC49782|nr:DsbE family thiol:disulfide interchange protein [Aureimonas sp. SA4125]BDA86661.1 thiol:disulfide interchange protein [Aureimonas sp. SA4125]